MLHGWSSQMLLWLFITFFFALTIKRLLDKANLRNEYFATVAETMHTLLMHGILLSDIHILLAEMNKEDPGVEVLFLLFTFLSFAILVTCAGVICQVVAAVASAEKEHLMIGYYEGVLREDFDGVDADGDGMINREEFSSLCSQPSACQKLTDIGVDVLDLVEMLDTVYDSVDAIAFTEFMELVLGLQGSNKATV